MFIFGSSGVGIAFYKEHDEFDDFIKIELNIPSLQTGAPEFAWWRSLFNADTTQAHALLFAKDEDNNNVPDENQIVKIYRYNHSDPQNPTVVDPDDFSNNPAFIREIQKAIAKEYYDSVVTGDYGSYANSVIYSTASNDGAESRNGVLFRDYIKIIPSKL